MRIRDTDWLQINSDVPYLILFNNTGSPALSIVLNVILFLLIYSGNVTALATGSREMWAFARDKVSVQWMQSRLKRAATPSAL